MNLQERNCLVCGKPFKARERAIKIGGGKYCSQECAHAARKKRVKAFCPICGKEFEPRVCRVSVGCGVYCSKECKDSSTPANLKNKIAVEFYRNKGWLETEYIENHRSMVDISKQLNISRWTIRHWLQFYNIEIRSPTERFCQSEIWQRKHNQRMIINNPSKSPEFRARLSQKTRGENNPAWKNGSSFEPYCPKFNEAFKEHIRDKFGRKCFLCSTTEAENGCKLSVHHIDYAKNSICNGKDWAFVPLCHKQHAQTNHNRWYWFNRLIYYWLEKYNLDFSNI